MRRVLKKNSRHPPFACQNVSMPRVNPEILSWARKTAGFSQSDVALSALRDDAIYPYINRADYAPTICPPASQIVFYAPCILILIAEFALRRRRKAEEAHADAVIA